MFDELTSELSTKSRYVELSVKYFNSRHWDWEAVATSSLTKNGMK